MTDKRRAAGAALDQLAGIMAALRTPVTGCPWDLEQTFGSVAPYTIEEAYEVAAAIGDGDMAALCEELGDLLLHVVFHSRMAEEAGAFTLADVVAAITAKLIRRHPHVFGSAAVAGSDAVRANWETIKEQEKPRAGALDGVALALPALMRAEKLQRRAARTGFDWSDASGPRAKIDEELAEIANASSAPEREHEIGDLLFAVVNYGRHLGVDAEAALRSANQRFERRFRAMEQMAGGCFPSLSLAGKDELWAAVKAQEDAVSPAAAADATSSS